MKVLVPLLVCLLFVSPLHSQNAAIKHLKYETLTINDGLSQGLVNCMLQDRYGFMWFGTKDGLNRYNGYQFTIFRHDPRDETTISDNFIQSVFEDSQGRLWIGTLHNGLDLFDRETESFMHFIHSDADSSESSSAELQEGRSITGLSSESIWALNEDMQGNIWVGTSRGIDVIRTNDGFEVFSQRYSITQTNIRFEVVAIAMTRNGKIFVTSFSNRLFRVSNNERGFDYQHLELDSLTLTDFDFGFVEKPELDAFRFVVVDTFRNQTWFLCGPSFICVDDEDVAVKKVINFASDEPFDVYFNGIIDSSGILLFTYGYSLLEINTRTGKVMNVQLDNFADPKAGRALEHIMRDRNGLLWIATNGYGLVKHNIRAEKFHHTGESSVLQMVSAPNNCVYIAILPWYSTFDPQAAAFIDSIRFHTWSFIGNGYNLYMYPRLIDRKNRCLIGLANKLFCYDFVKKTGVEYKLPVEVIGDLNEFQQQILEDHAGFIWIATASGLFRFEEDKQLWQHFTNVKSDTTSISTDKVFSLCLDPKQPEKYLWIGTDGGGLNRMDMTTGKFISYTTHDGLPNNVVYGVLNDDEGKLWLSTNKGLSCFDPVKRMFKNYEDKDGLQSNEFNHRAYCRLPNGLLFFGGVNGFNYFNPKEIQDNTNPPKVLITGVSIRNKTVSFKEENSLLQAPAYLTKQITVPYSQNMITFEFASMDFSGPEKNLFQYRLEGFDMDWVRSGTNHFATYTNLDPGTYTFLLKGSNSDGVWNELPASMKLIILPPWYMTWWFRAAVVLAVCGLLYSFYRYRLQQALRLQSVRNRIAQDLHDEIGSNLSNISIFSEVAEEKSGESDSVKPLLQKITHYTQTSQEAMGDIVWMINANNDRFENIIVRMRAIAAELFEAKNFLLHLNFDERLNSVKLGMEERKNFYLIFKEAINNIAKYADCKNVWIEMTLHHDSILLVIRDDGKGFEQHSDISGNGLTNMKRRAEMLHGVLGIHSEKEKGTKVELKFRI